MVGLVGGSEGTHLSQARLTGATVVMGLEDMRKQGTSRRRARHLHEGYGRRRADPLVLLVQRTCCAYCRGDIFDGALCHCTGITKLALAPGLLEGQASKPHIRLD